jgi:transposase, IS6 family
MILLAVGWYLRFSLSYRDVEELLAERGLRADHVTVWRWVQRYAPELERRLRSRLNSTNDRRCANSLKRALTISHRKRNFCIRR